MFQLQVTPRDVARCTFHAGRRKLFLPLTNRCPWHLMSGEARSVVPTFKAPSPKHAPSTLPKMVLGDRPPCETVHGGQTQSRSDRSTDERDRMSRRRRGQLLRKPGEMRVTPGDGKGVFRPQVTVTRAQRPSTGNKEGVALHPPQARARTPRLSAVATADGLRILPRRDIRRGVWHVKCERNLSAKD